MKYIDVRPGMIPGIIVKGGAAYQEVGGTLYQVLAFRQEPEYGLVPILDIPPGGTQV